MNTIDEQIAILQAFKAGEKIEWCVPGKSRWSDHVSIGYFNFRDYKYRTSEKTITLQCELTEKEAERFEAFLTLWEPFGISLESVSIKLLNALKDVK